MEFFTILYLISDVPIVFIWSIVQQEAFYPFNIYSALLVLHITY